MKGRKSGTKCGNYIKTCYFSKQPTSYSGDKKVSESEHIYSFAKEFKSLDGFLEEYSELSNTYDFSTYQTQTGVSRIRCYSSERLQVNNKKHFCKKCKKTQPEFYKTCDDRKFVSQEYLISLSISDPVSSDRIYCESCSRTTYIYTYRNNIIRSDVNSELQDVRLLSHPSCLLIKRSRIKCPNCGRLIGETHHIGFQAYCDGKMTVRLAENVLYAQLSSIKRSYIAEAYGLSMSQVDRIKERLIHQSRNIRAIHLSYAMKDGVSGTVTSKTIKDTATGHVYYLYFLCRSDSDIVLIDIMTQAERDALSLMNTDKAQFEKYFDDPNRFFLACYCCLAGEKGLVGEELNANLERLERWHEENIRKETKHVHSDDLYMSKLNNELFQRALDKKMVQLLRRKKINTPYEDHPKKQYKNGLIDIFLSTLYSTLQKYKTPSTIVKETLMLFNPSTVTMAEIEAITGRALTRVDYRTLLFEGAYMITPPLGASLPCLIHFLQSGLFDTDHDQLFPCALISGIQTDENGNTILPCGLSESICPQLKYGWKQY